MDDTDHTLDYLDEFPTPEDLNINAQPGGVDHEKLEHTTAG